MSSRVGWSNYAAVDDILMCLGCLYQSNYKLLKFRIIIWWWDQICENKNSVIFQFTIIRESDGKERRDFGQWKKGAEFNGFVLEEESIAVKTSKREERSWGKIIGWD